MMQIADEETKELLQRYGSRLKLTAPVPVRSARRPEVLAAPSTPRLEEMPRLTVEVEEEPPAVPEKQSPRSSANLDSISQVKRGTIRTSEFGPEASKRSTTKTEFAPVVETEDAAPRRGSCLRMSTSHGEPGAPRASIAAAPKIVSIVPPVPEGKGLGFQVTPRAPGAEDKRLGSNNDKRQHGSLLRGVRKDRLREKQAEILKKAKVGHFRQHLQEQFDSILEVVESSFSGEGGKQGQTKGVPLPTIHLRSGARNLGMVHSQSSNEASPDWLDTKVLGL
jgi:hypothetical protein